MHQGLNQTAFLREEERSRVLIDTVTACAIYMLDPGGRVASWNAAAQRFKGYRTAEIIGRPFSLFFTEDDRRAGVPERALRIATAEGRFESEGWCVRKDGSRFWAHMVIDPIRAPDGTLIGFAKITRNIDGRKTAEEVLRQSEEQFRLLVQGVTDYAIYMLDPSGRVTNWNPGAQRIKGYTPEEIIGQHFSKFYAAEDRERGEPQRGLEIARREGRFEKEGWRIRKNGTRFWAHVVIDAIRDPDGGLIGFAKITRDITERMEAQRALEQTREALFLSQKMEALGRLTGGVAHDFNNLLMAIQGSLELAKKRVSDPKTLSLLENGINAAQRGASLTRRMLMFARRQELDASAVDLKPLVQGLTDLMEGSLGPAFMIQTRIAPGLPEVWTDPSQLESALLNLMVNARDAMPDGGSIVIAACEAQPPAEARMAAGRYVCLSVTDDGLGMDEQTLARAREPFFTTKGIGKGTGLGLSMIDGMVDQLGGRFLLKSEPGHGTTAELWLPVAPNPSAAAEGPSRDAAPTPPLTVLAVDDDGLVLMNTAAMLEDLGHTVLTATSGRQALEVLRRQKVDLVISDHAMPQMTGLQLADAIRSDWPSVPLILATGYAEIPQDGAPVLKLSKPFFQDQLAQAIGLALTR